MQEFIGRTLGRYSIVEQIGAGGMGVVYRAHDERLDRDVAIKVLPEQFAQEPDHLARFEREAKAVARLDHPNILSIHDIGTDHGVTYAVMELLEGTSLRQVMSGDGVTIGKALEYTKTVAAALAAAHDKGIVHRDLKPENVFLTVDGRIKVLDFGLAKLLFPNGGLATDMPTASLKTAPGALLGTLAYMAPEQVQGRPVDQRADIFALGVMLYEMLAGRRPFGGSNTIETAAAILQKDPKPISATVPGVPSGLESVLKTCLEKRPEDRFSSVRDLMLTLKAMEPSTGPPPQQEGLASASHPPQYRAVVIGVVVSLCHRCSLSGFSGAGSPADRMWVRFARSRCCPWRTSLATRSRSTSPTV